MRRLQLRAVLATALGGLIVTLATPASAKWVIAEARISGPGVEEGGLRISGPATERLWDSGIDVAGGLDDARPNSVLELGLTDADLGPRYLIIYQVDSGTKTAETVRQELYPYAEGGPVTYTPRGQHIADGLPWGGAISPGWHRSPTRFLRFLVDEGLPATSPVVGSPKSVPNPEPRSTPWVWIALVVAGLVTLTLSVPRLRRAHMTAR